MGISIQSKTDYSALFSSFNTSSSSSSSSSSNILADYASIKNGSYYKLMKQYYSNNSNSDVSSLTNKSASKDDSKTIARVQSDANSLKNASGDLLKMKEYDSESAKSSVSKFIDSYNSIIKSAATSNNNSILSTASHMTTQTAATEKTLAQIGITVNSDNTLSLSESSFKNAKTETIASLFSGNGSYAYNIQTKASFIEMYAINDAVKASGIYGSSANYVQNALGTGSNYSNLF